MPEVMRMPEKESSSPWNEKQKKKDMTSLYPLLLLIAQNSIMLDPAANKIFFLVPTNVLELSQKNTSDVVGFI